MICQSIQIVGNLIGISYFAVYYFLTMKNIMAINLLFWFVNCKSNQEAIVVSSFFHGVLCSRVLHSQFQALSIYLLLLRV